MVRFRSPRARPQPSSEPAGPVPGPGGPVESPILEATDAAAPTRRRPRPRPLPSPRPEAQPVAEDELEDDELEDDEYWDDEYEDDLEDEYEDDYDDEIEDEYEELGEDELEDDEYWDDEYEDDELEGETGVATDGPRGRRGRRKLFRRRSRRAVEPAAAVEPSHAGPEADPDAATGPVGEAPATSISAPARPSPGPAPQAPVDDEPAAAAVPAPRRRPRLPQLPSTDLRGGVRRGVTGVRTGVGRGATGVRTGVTRARTGVVAAASWVRHHWSRAAYTYLAIVGIALLVSLLLYWRSGFTYDECTYCGVPVLLSVSPWWLLVLPFGFDSWPWLVPLAVLLVFALINAELVHRWSKRPQPIYPDWD